MKFMPKKHLKSDSKKLWKALEDDEIVITSDGKPQAIMIKAEENFEQIMKLLSQLKAEVALEELRMESIQKKKNQISEEEIEKEITDQRSGD